jgi:glycosyltransferase involved in cell wall biosynthesis
MVLLYGPPWFGAARFSKHHLARYLAGRGHRLLYVEAPLGPMTLARRAPAAWPELRSTSAPPQPVAERLWVRRYFNPIPYHDASPLTATRTANRLGQRLMAANLRRDLRRLGFREPLLIAGLPHAADLGPLVRHRGLVYHCADDYAHVRGFPRTLPALEADLCRQADLVVVTAETLCQPRLAYNPRTHWIPNGVDFPHFAQAAHPAPELRARPRPVLGFVGGIAQWVDVPLLAWLARQRPAWQLALIGPASTDVSALAGLPNVHLLGPRPYCRLPEYLAAMDVALIPFRRDQVSHHADPIKAYEYLAAGLPVVATAVPALQRLSPVIRLADSAETFLAQLEAALAEGRASGAAQRRAEAARHTWPDRFAEFETLLRRYALA